MRRADPNDPQRSSTHLVIDRALPGGTALTDRAVVVRTSDARYLLTGGSRLRVAGDEQALVALKMAGATNLTVGQQLLNAVPVGPDLRKPAIAGDGGASGLTVAGRPARIGQVYQAAGQYYVLTRRGLATVREVTALLLLGGGGEVTQITPTRRAGSSPTSAWTRTACRPGCRRCTRSVRGGRCSAPPTGPARPVSHRHHAGGLRLPTGRADLGDRDARRQGARDAVRTAESVLLPGGKGGWCRPRPGRAARRRPVRRST
ncbi:type VII secretion protein EccB [Micromonospora sp. b486]|uniref:type VII secretion protein EccB n=1 Tax=Micromonospora sp. b486 TaxID=3053986 RepID=UPI00259D1058|nr:type VII secretion protein EccB [Micromonospora sp. b486]MDM4784674.1 type VII secretion protein EccB [Micromonospora sp. b486]